MRRHITQWAVLEVALAVIVSACAGSSPTPSSAVESLDGPELTAALDSIHGSQIKQHMSVLADDRLEGRGLGSAGYDGALAYVETTLKSYGLQPAGEQGGFHQRVPLRNSVMWMMLSSLGAAHAILPSSRSSMTRRSSRLLLSGEYVV